METQAHTPLGKRIARYFVLVSVLAVLTVTFLVTQRLSRDALALLIGLSCGLGTMLPTLGLGWFILRRETMRQRADTHAPHPSATPPVIVVTPQALPPGYSADRPVYIENPAAPWATSGKQRNFTIVGGDE